MEKTYQREKIKTPFKEVRKYDLQIYDNSYYNLEKKEYIEGNFTIGTESDYNIGIYPNIEGKNGKKYIYKDYDQLIKDVYNEKKMVEIQKDLYGKN